MKGILGKLFAHNLAVVAESKHEMQEVLGELKKAFWKQGLSMEKKGKETAEKGNEYQARGEGDQTGK